MALDFSKTSKMINKVMGETNEINMDEKKRDIPLDEIDENPKNEYLFGYADQDYADEIIGEDGFHGVIEVCALPNGRYEILSGHRRYRACKTNGYKTIPCVVNEYMSDDERLKRVIRGNVLNRKLTPLNYARCMSEYKSLIMRDKKYKGKTSAEIARFFHVSQAGVERYLSLNKLIPEFQNLCDQINYPYTNLLGVAALPKETQENLYKELAGIAPDGNIADLSRSVIEQQIQVQLRKEQRALDGAKTRGIPQRESLIREDLPADKSQQNTDSAVEEKGIENIQAFGDEDDYVFDSDHEDMAGGSMQQDVQPPLEKTEAGFSDDTADEEYSSEPDKQDEESSFARDSEILFYIDRIEQIAAEGAIFDNKQKIIDQLNRLIELVSR